MIVIALAQGAVAILIGAVLVQRGKRGFGWALIAIGAGIAVLGSLGLAGFSP